MLAFSTKGTGSNDELRLRTLLQNFDAEFLPFDRTKKVISFFSLLRKFRKSSPTLVIMEGTGIAGGLACLCARVFGHRYVVSSGDAVGPFVAVHHRWLRIPFDNYERVLYRNASGFIGWTPYLVGRALTFGCPTGVTAAGWVIGNSGIDPAFAREAVRARFGIPNTNIVYGIVGSLAWSKTRQYCYGLELVQAIKRTSRKDITALIVGDGDGMDRLKSIAGEDLGRRVIIPGAVPLDEVMSMVHAFDVASLPQSLDAVGSFRYTTKISEYRSARLPIVTLRIPAAYDLDLSPCWRLPGRSPWDTVFVAALADLMEKVTRTELELIDAQVSTQMRVFSREDQIVRVTAYLSELQ